MYPAEFDDNSASDVGGFMRGTSTCSKFQRYLSFCFLRPCTNPKSENNISEFLLDLRFHKLQVLKQVYIYGSTHSYECAFDDQNQFTSDNSSESFFN